MTKTVVEPMKKLNGEFPSIAAALKKRDSTLRCERRRKDFLTFI